MYCIVSGAKQKGRLAAASPKSDQILSSGGCEYSFTIPLPAPAEQTQRT